MPTRLPVRFVVSAVACLAFASDAAAQQPTASTAPGLPEKTVLVLASEGSVDDGQSGAREVVDEALVRALPLPGRNFVQLSSLAAGFTGNPNFPTPQGQSNATNNVLVDGMSHFSKWRSGARGFSSGYGLESIREVQVLTNPVSAELGEGLGAITNAVTKSGTDRFRGSTVFFLQNEALNARPDFTTRKPPAGAQQYGFTLGGPLVKDRTVFWGSYEGRRSRNHHIVVSPIAAGAVVPDNEDEHLLFFRLDDHRSTSHEMMARYSAQLFRWHEEIGGLVLPGTGTLSTNRMQTMLLTDGVQLSQRALNEARFQFARYSDVRRDLNASVFVSRAGYSVEGGTLGARGFGAEPEDTWEATDTLSYWRGSHRFKFGGGVRYVRAHNTSVSYGRGAYFFAGPPDLFPQPFSFIEGLAPTEAAATVDPRSVSASGFVQDDWRLLARVTVNLGLRYDIEDVWNVRNFDVPVDKNNVQPRLGAVWDISEKGHVRVRGGAGLYTQQHLLAYINRVQLEGLDGAMTLIFPPDSALFPTFPQTLSGITSPAAWPPRDIHRVDVTFNNPYSIQAGLGVEGTLFKKTMIAADFAYLDGRDLMSIVDANAPASNQKPTQRGVAEADLTRPMVPVANAYRKIITLGNLGRSSYHAWQFRADRSIGRLKAMASYTLSHAEDMASYQLPEDSRNISAERARASTDVKHRLATGFTWDVSGPRGRFPGWSLAGIGMFHSNRPYDVTWGDDWNGTTQNDARPGGRNTGQTDAFANVDLAVTKRFAVRSRTVEARVEAFNVFNTTNFDEYVGALLSPLFAQPVSAFPKRRLQLAAIVRF